MSFRKEIKFKTSSSDFINVKAELLKMGFHAIHNERKVNSEYFGNMNLDMHSDWEEGTIPRKKLRLRWYNNQFKEQTLEKKYSAIEGRFKTSKSISFNETKKLRETGQIDNEYGILTPSLRVSYQREYMQLGIIRATFDFNIEYLNLRNKRISRDEESVIELKLPISADESKIVNIIPIITARFSKYCRGILSTHII